ncbi:MAG: hypothetical protein IKP67_08355 [Spirochaetales bacterium]|nr:hypothetical protein [Spirochaetales bacterium]
MMKRFYFLVVAAIIAFGSTLGFIGCGDVKEQPPKPTTTVEVVATTSTVVEQPTGETTTTSTTTTTTTIYVPDDKRLKFTISDNMSKDALRRNMQSLFAYIEEKIADKDFNVWYGSLSKAYRGYISDKKNLEMMSKRSDYLANKGIVLQSPEEYFRMVVIEAREGEKLRFFDYKYIDKTHVKVICVNDFGKFSYNFVYEDNMWKLDR